MSKKASTEILKGRGPFNLLFVFCLITLMVVGGFVILRGHAAYVNDPMKFGFNGDWCLDYVPCTETEAINRLHDQWNMGVRWMRHDYEWSNIQGCNPHKTSSCLDPKNWDWGDNTRWDEFTKQAVNLNGSHKGFKILATLDYSPNWAMGETPDQYATDYAAYVTGFIQHYKSLGYTHNDMVIELGNEEDLPNGTWCTDTGCVVPQTSWPEYVARKEHAAYAAIKKVDPSIMVVSGFSGFNCDAEASSVPCPNGGWDMVAFYRALYKFIEQPSINWKTSQMYDYLGVHPYCWGADTGKPIGDPTNGGQNGDCPWNEMLGVGAVAPANSIMGVMKAHGDNQVIWPTEIGFYWLQSCAINPNPPHNRIKPCSVDQTAKNQQQMVVPSVSYVYDYMQQTANASKFGPMFWFSYKNGADVTDLQWGVYSGNDESVLGNPLPAYYAYKAAAQKFSGGGAKPGDINNDGKVNAADFLILLSNWHKTGTGLPGDLNNDGKVDVFDMSILAANWTG